MKRVANAPSEQLTVDQIRIDAWHGLRYARSVARFETARPETGRLAVSRQHEVPVFPQLPSRLAAAMGSSRANPQAEDAFFLNIWSPADAGGLPVILFIHGGAWLSGGGAMTWYDGSRIAARGMVVVNVNYRLGPLGHLGRSDAHPLPLPAADLLLALQWVLDHVRGFGGDPGRITVAGQSAGGWYAHLLSVLPETRGLIHRVALLSMGTRRPWSLQYQSEVTHRAALSCGEDLAAAPVDAVLRAGMAALGKASPVLGHAPSGFLPVAGTAVPARLFDPDWAARACHAEAVHIRWTADEAAMFFFNAPEQYRASQSEVDETLAGWAPEDLPPVLRVNGRFCGASSDLSPYRQLVAAASWRQFQRFPAEYADRLRQTGRSVQQTVFTARSSLDRLLSGHCFDLPFQFGRRETWADAPMLAGIDPDRFESMAHPLMTELSAFAHG